MVVASFGIQIRGLQHYNGTVVSHLFEAKLAHFLTFVISEVYFAGSGDFLHSALSTAAYRYDIIGC